MSTRSIARHAANVAVVALVAVHSYLAARLLIEVSFGPRNALVMVGLIAAAFACVEFAPREDRALFAWATLGTWATIAATAWGVSVGRLS